MRPGRLVRLSTAALLLVALASLVSAEAFDHTDDGCAVEVHCVLCQWHQGTAAVLAVVPLPRAPIAACPASLVVPATPLRDGDRLETASRAPPLVS
jgi:hypothetical protein